jgi:P27 family predicted phage terminase small subunit
VKRGRKSDRPAVKKAKAGHFRKPESRARRPKKLPTLSVEERAQMLAGLPDGEVPEFFTEGGDFRQEVKIWKDLSADLHRINALQRLDRYGFAMYCVHMADWIKATLEIKIHGPTYKARNTINGDVLHKLSPWVKVRETAEKHILALAGSFGLDPMSRFKMLGVQAGLAGQGFLPFDREPAKAETAASEGEGEDIAPTGILARSASPPPRPH